ncbi:hypothetical protein NL676_001823 [Syzygium grande]|nr:hypothetical protein NL676_001823 [Syzygium grande]
MSWRRAKLPTQQMTMGMRERDRAKGRSDGHEVGRTKWATASWPTSNDDRDGRATVVTRSSGAPNGTGRRP